MLTSEEIQKLAQLSRLEVQDSEIEGLQKHFEKMLAHMEDLKECPVEGLDPLTTVDEDSGFVREDVVGTSLTKDVAFMNSPSVDQNHFTIPKVMG